MPPPDPRIDGMNTTDEVRVRKVHLDYTGADGMPKPMAFLLASGPDQSQRDHEEKARRIFQGQFPEWRVRCCAAEEVDMVLPQGSLVGIPGETGAWVAG